MILGETGIDRFDPFVRFEDQVEIGSSGFNRKVLATIDVNSFGC